MEGRKGTTHVTTTEDGIVVTGDKAEALEARVLASFRRPFFLLGVLMVVIFVLLLGGSVFLNHLDGTVNRMDKTVANTDKIVTEVAGPEARKAQAGQQQKFIDGFTQGMNCSNQNNLQRFVDQMAKNGFPELDNVNVIKPPCVKEE